MQDITLEATPIIEERRSTLNGQIISIKYSKGKFLGKGGFARVQEFTCLETKKVLAAKVVPKSSLVKTRAKQKLMSEIRIHRSLDHAHVVRFDHFFEDSEQVQILLELCSNQTINEKLRRRKRLTEIEVQCQIMQIISGLKQLHRHKVIHRDLKLGNLFLTDKMELKLGDFGLATKLEFDGEKKRTICGTPNYIAPEILEGKTGHSYEVDIWSLGVVIYTMLIGKPPFETNDVKTTQRKIRMNSYTFPENVACSSEGKNLISKILHLNPQFRPSLDEILAHEFFHKGNTIPKLLPSSTLACAPSDSMLKQFSGPTVTAEKPFTSRVNTETNDAFNNANYDINNKLNANTERVQRPEDKMMINRNNTMRDSKDDKDKDKDKEKDKGMRTLAMSVYNPNFLDYNGGDAVNKGPDVWVRKWVDYSSKYGLGYLLSNGACGVFFNDSTKIVLKPDTQLFEQMERRTTEKQDVAKEHKLDDYPKELHKKVTLLQHFKSYLEGGPSDSKFVQPSQNTHTVFVKKWMRTKHAIMFRLSNKIVQVNFQDHTEIILSSEARVVTQVNKKGRRSTHPLSTALESTNVEMSKRLKYTKDILTHMLTTGLVNKKE